MVCRGGQPPPSSPNLPHGGVAERGAEAEPLTPAAMRQLPPIPADHARQLAEVGYVVVPQMFSADVLARAEEAVKRLLAEEGDAAGSEFRQEDGVERLAAAIFDLFAVGHFFLCVIDSADGYVKVTD